MNNSTEILKQNFLPFAKYVLQTRALPNDDDCLKLSLPIKNINDELYKKIFNNFRSLESFSKKVYK